MKRVFMLSSQLMFSRGIENLLRQDRGLELVGREVDVERALTCIRVLQPDVVILDGKDLASTPASVVAAILSAAPKTRVFSLNLGNDQLLVYHGEQRRAQGIDDLRAAIHESPAQPARRRPRPATRKQVSSPRQGGCR